MNKTHYLFLGPNGSGKTTQCKILAAILEAQAVDSSRVLKISSAYDHDFGNASSSAMSNGEFVADELIIPQFHNYMGTLSSGQRCVFCGIPRLSSQVPWFLEAVKSTVRLDSGIVAVEIGITPELAASRCAERLAEARRRGLTPRPDDKEEVVLGRLKRYAEVAPALEAALVAAGVEVRKIESQAKKNETLRAIVNVLGLTADDMSFSLA